MFYDSDGLIKRVILIKNEIYVLNYFKGFPDCRIYL